MSLTLGLNTALSGLLTNQRGLDVIAQNVVNVNTKGYTRKVMNPESRVLGGTGAGVQEGSIIRSVDEGLMRDLRRQSSTLGQLETEQQYYPRIEDLFGDVAADTSLAHKVLSLQSGFEVLATEATKPTQQWGSVQAALDTTDLLGQMTSSLQALRLEADRGIEDTVELVNEQLTAIADLNQKIVRNNATNSGIGDLSDHRDLALTELASMIDIQYFERADGSMLVYTSSGRTLVDNTANLMTHAATSAIDPSLSLAGGNFNTITFVGQTRDLSDDFQNGQVRALLDLRDSIIPNLQANIDEMASKLKSLVNTVHNRGTVLPAIASTFSGTRTFATQGDVVQAATDTAPTIFYSGGTTVTDVAGGAGAGFGSLTFNNTNTTYPYRATITAATAASLNVAGLAVGQTFSISGSSDSRNDGTYTVVATTGTVLTVDKANARQTIAFAGTDDTVVALFDTNGDQLERTTVRGLMQVDYTGSWSAGDSRGKDDFEAKSSAGPWSINEVAAHLEGWLKANDYNSASVALNSEGHLIIDIGSSTTTLAFRDQGSSTAGADASDATIKFDVDGDTVADETVSGFSNFFGLNDFFVSDYDNAVTDSNVLAGDVRTSSARVMRILDISGQVGNSISIPSGSTLSDVAELINNNTMINESIALTSPNFTITSAATFTMTDGTGQTIATASFAAGALTLDEIAGTLTTGGIKAAVVKEGSAYRLRVWDASGDEMEVTVSGGAVSGSPPTLGARIGMTQSQRIRATVIPEGSGFRLRIANTQDQELFIAADQDAQGKSIVDDLGLHHAATRAAGGLGVRADIQTAPERISRGAMQWNADASSYMLSEGDNTTALQLGAALGTKTSVATSGSIYAGQYTMAEFAAATISVVARGAAHSESKMDYQVTLTQSLEFQQASVSGVNLDEEVANMINFQQAYSASAKIISTLQEMLEILVNIVK